MIHFKDNSFSIIDKFVIENQNDSQPIVRSEGSSNSPQLINCLNIKWLLLLKVI